MDEDWTRNIQQTFDVVRQEVDEFVSMDTLRYVENQVQTFGESVKGFCSNVLQDFLPPALSIPVNHDADTVPQEGKFVMETYQKSITNLKEKHVDSNPVIHDAESVPQKGKIVTETRKKSATNLKEKYVDTNTELLPSALSNPVNHDAESVPQKGKHATQNSDKPLIIIKEKQDLGHHRLNNAKQTMPMPTEGEEKLRKALFPLARDEFALVHDNVKSSGVGYIGSEFERLVAKEKSLSDSNSIGINDETSLVFVTEDDYFNQELTDESVSTAVDDSLRVCLSDKERTCDTFFDDCHCQTIGIPPSSEVECSFSRGCQVVEPTLMSSTSSLSNDSYYQSGFCTIPHETESFVCDLTDSVGTVSETSGHADESKFDISDPKMKTIDLSEKSKLSESCVIVDNKLPLSTSWRPRTRRSYKQMVKDAYTKTGRLTREYELLGILYGDIDKEPDQHEKHSSRLPSISKITAGNEQSLTKDLSDCDWELL